MSYEKQTWNKYDELKTEEENIKNGAVVTDNRMNHMESGIGDNDNNLTSHLANTNNPHKVTAVQIGLDKVINVKQASKVEFDSHTSNNSNPHKVTAAQVGLDKVDNIQQAAKTDFVSHVNNKSNPHSVTASQVGAYSKTESDAKFATGQSLTDLSNKAFVNKGNLASGTDLNNVTDTGYYRIGGLVGGTDILNLPSELSGIRFYALLTVIGVLQELTVYAPIKNTTWTYSRYVSGIPATWSVWSKTVMADDSGKVTVKTLQVETIKSNSDTDLLNLSLTGVASATFSYIRINGIVYITAAGNWGNFPDNKQRIVGNIPAGFRPPTDWGTGMNPQGGSRLLSAVIKANGDLGVTSDAAQNNVYGQFSMSYPGI